MAESGFIPSFGGGLQQDAETGEVTPVFGSGAEEIVQGNDLRLSTAQKKTVKLNPGDGQFSDIQAAIDSITDASASKPYQVNIGPGVYNISDAIVCKPFVFLRGERTGTIINQTDETKPCIIGAPASTVSQVALTGSGISGTDVGLIEYNGDDTILAPFRMDIIDFQNCHTMFKSVVGAGDTMLCTINLATVSSTITTKAFSLSGTGTGTLLVSNFTAQFVSVGNAISNLFDVRNSNCRMIINNSLSVIEGAATGTNLFNVEDGATLNCQSIGAEGYDVGLNVPNVGVGPEVNISALSMINMGTNSIKIDNPNAVGFVNGSWSQEKTSVNPNATVAISHSDPDQNDIGFVIQGDILQGKDEDQILNFTKLLRETATIGLFEGGSLTRGTGAFEVDVASGIGFIRDGSGVVQEILFDATTLTIGADQTRFVTVNGLGVVQLEASLPTNLAERIILGRISSGDLGIIALEESALRTNDYGNQVEKILREGLGILFTSGALISENATTDRSIDITQGEFFFGTKKFNVASGTGLTFNRVFRDGSGGFTLTTGQTVVPNNLYDDGSGTLQSVPNNDFVKHTVIQNPDEAGGFRYSVLIGQETYNSLGEAVDGDSNQLPPQINNASTPIAEVITQEGSANFAEILDVRPRLGFAQSAASSVSDHGSLLGLGDDDHQQYLLVNGNRAMSGNFDLGGNDIVNAGNIPGTNPGTPTTNPLGQANTEGVSSLKARADHVHNIPTAAPVNLGTANAEGASTSAARADHVHAHANQPGGTLHALATITVAGFMSATDKSKIDNYPTLPSGIDHNTLQNLDVGDVHTQYLNRSGVRSMTGDFNMGGNSITNVSLVDGVDVSAHAARHLPSGADPIATASAISISGSTTNTEGNAESFARSNHTHNILTGTVSTQTPDQANAEGASPNLARADHTHNIPAASPEGALGANSTNTEGNNPSFARSNHTHDIATGVVSAQQADQTNAEGTSNNLARADHIHNIATAIASTISGSTVNTQGTSNAFAKADHLHNILTGVVSPLNPDQANAEGTSPNLARADHIHNIPADTAVNVSDTNAEGNSSSFARANHTHNIFPILEISYDNAEAIQITSSTTFQSALNFSRTLNGGTYLVIGSYNWDHDSGTNDFEGQFLVDGAQVYFHKQEPKDSGGGGPSGTSQRHAAAFIYSFAKTGSTTFDFQYRTDTGGVNSSVERVRIFIVRIA
jgi:hypothetical protein